MTLNLSNPITENLSLEQLAGKADDCYTPRIGYEVAADGERFALLPLFSEGEEAKIGETVTVSSLGLPRRAQVVRVLSGYEETYTDREIVGQNESTYEIRERTHDKSGMRERSYEIEIGAPTSQ